MEDYNLVLLDINLTPAIVLNEIAENLSFDKQNALLDIPCEHPFDHGNNSYPEDFLMVFFFMNKPV